MSHVHPHMSYVSINMIVNKCVMNLVNFNRSKLCTDVGRGNMHLSSNLWSQVLYSEYSMISSDQFLNVRIIYKICIYIIKQTFKTWNVLKSNTNVPVTKLPVLCWVF